MKKIVRGLADLHYHNIVSSDRTWLTRCDVPIDAIDNFCSLMVSHFIIRFLILHGFFSNA